MATFSEVRDLINSNEKEALALKLHEFGKMALNPAVADEAVQAGGVRAMIHLSMRNDQHQSQALKILLALLSRPEGLNALEPERLDLFQTLYANLYATRPAVVMQSLDLLRILVEFYDDSFQLVLQAAQSCSARRGDCVYAVLVSKLTRGLKTEVQAGTRVLSALVVKSVAAASLDSFLAALRKVDVMTAIATAQKMVPEDQQALHQALKRLFNLCTPEKNVESAMEQTSLQNDQLAACAFKANSTGLAARVTALTGLAELAGITSNEGMMMQVLNQHLKQMEEKLQAMTQEQQIAANLAIEKQQAAMDAQMQAQKDFYEKKLYELMSNDKLGAIEKDNAALALQIEELKANQAGLIEEYNKNQLDVSEQNYLRQHKQLWLFYQCIQMKMNELFLGYKTLASGVVAHEAQGGKAERALVTAITIAGDLVPFPGAATVATLITGSMRLYKGKKAEAKTGHTAATAVSVSNMEQISEHCARVLALRYEPQLRALEDQGARLLGECAVRRMMEAMRVGCLECLDPTTDNKQISKQLVDTITQVDKKQGTMCIKHLTIPTVSTAGLKWHEQDIFKKPGIRTVEGEYYFSPGETDVAKYGYRVGTAEEAKSLNYMKSRTRLSSALDLNSSSELSFSRSFSRSSNVSTQPPLPKSASLSTSALLPPAEVAALPSNEVSELKKLVQSQRTAMEDMQKRIGELESSNLEVNKRLVQMEAVILLLSAKLPQLNS